ncbi:MAG: hypothetical protein DRP65_00440 [Planctomycetota bacterium]|nr:MAG: hypothetical protein DRP65_00440 [Planctomycetota bacterium]
MFVKTITTYRGKHGLFVAGQFYNISKATLAAIKDELAAQQLPPFKYAKATSQQNRPSKKQGKSNEQDPEAGQAGL